MWPSKGRGYAELILPSREGARHDRGAHVPSLRIQKSRADKTKRIAGADDSVPAGLSRLLLRLLRQAFLLEVQPAGRLTTPHSEAGFTVEGARRAATPTRRHAHQAGACVRPPDRRIVASAVRKVSP